MLYFDNAATTAMSPAALSAMTQVMAENFGNPSSIHQYGRRAAQVLREARQTIAKLLEVNSSQILFTSGGTESNNTAIKGYALSHQHLGKHLITTAIEHHAILEVMEDLVQQHGFELTILEFRDGLIQVEDLKKALRPDTILVSAMMVNNETGYQLPIADMGQLLKDHQAVFHVDAVQAMGKIPIHPLELGIDFLSASAHKFHGPKGIGFLFSKENNFQKLLLGGDQEDKRRAGTENLPAIAGMAAALEEDLAHWQESYELVSQLKEELLAKIQVPYYLNQASDSLPFVVNIGFPASQNALTLLKMDLEGIALSTGSACTAGAVEPSHVLEALYGKNAAPLTESIRISFSKYNTSEQVELLAEKINQIIGD